MVILLLLSTLVGCLDPQVWEASPEKDEDSQLHEGADENANNDTDSVDYAALYVPVLESWQTAIRESANSKEWTLEENPCPFICQFIPVEFDNIYYAYHDVDDNGIPELCIASFNGDQYCYIIDIYTIYGDKPVRLFVGVEDRGFWSRNNLDFSSDGNFLIIHKSGGASYWGDFVYKILPNGYRVEMVEGYTTYSPDNDDDITPHYHLPNGMQKATWDDYLKLCEKYFDKKYVEDDKTPQYFSDFHTQLEWTLIS
jgi:hypothetical protein